MQGSTPRWIVLPLAMIALTAAAQPARAAFDATLIGTVTASTAGVTTFSYTLTVLADSTMPANEIDIALAVPIDATSILSSSNILGFYNAGDPDIQFYYVGPGIGIGGLGVDDTATFSFSSTGAVGQAGYAIGGPDPTQPGLSGMVLAPVVPEPSSLILCGLGAIAAPLAIRRNRRRPTA